MTRTSASPAGRNTRPLVVRAAHTWYAWTGLALTVAGSYLAANGQLRVGDGPQLRADGPNPVSWKPTDPPGKDAPR